MLAGASGDPYRHFDGQLRGHSYVQVPVEDDGQPTGFLLYGLLRSVLLLEPGHRELVALPRPRSADDTADDQRVGLACHEVASR
jgi:hypothetical protein